MSATFGAIPGVVSPGQSLTGLTLSCANAGPAAATAADCVPTADVGTVSNLSCSPATPTSLASGSSIACTFDYLAPGTAGGTDTAETDVTFTGTASASNDSNAGNNVDTASADVIDALDDAVSSPGGSTGQTFDVSSNDDVPAGSSFSVTGGCLLYTSPSPRDS